jgi:non-specific serine/threonine protein kinase
MYAQGLASIATEQGDQTRAAELYDEALSLWRSRSDPWGVGIALLSVGQSARALGNLRRSAESYHEALALFADHGDQAKVASCIEGLGHLAAINGNAEQASRLFGAAEAIYEPLGFRLPHHDRKAYDPALAAVRAASDEETRASAWAAGRRLPLELAIVEARDVAESLAGTQD